MSFGPPTTDFSLPKKITDLGTQTSSLSTNYIGEKTGLNRQKSFSNKVLFSLLNITLDKVLWLIENSDSKILRKKTSSLRKSVKDFITKIVEKNKIKKEVSWEKLFVEYFLEKYFGAKFSSFSYFKDFRNFDNEEFLSPIRKEFLSQIGLTISDIEKEEPKKRQSLILLKLGEIDHEKTGKENYNYELMFFEKRIFFLYIYILLFAEGDEKINLERELDMSLYLYNLRN